MDSQPKISPIQLAPEEVWEQIFRHLKDPMDIYYCTKACGDWKNMFENSQKKTILLLRCVFPLIEKYIGWNDKLNLTAVNKELNSSITKLLQKYPEWNPLPTSYSIWMKYKQLQEGEFPLICNGTIFPNESVEESFMNGMIRNNPFPNRTLIIHPCTFGTRPRGEVNLYPEICVQYGALVWHLAYFLRNDESQPISEFYDFLNYFPNLQSLTVVNDMNVNGSVDGFTEKELPILHSLKTLRVLYYSGGTFRHDIFTHAQETAIYKHLLQAYGSQLETLEGDLPLLDKAKTIPFGKLTALKSGGVDLGELRSIQEGIGHLPLSSLSIMVKYPYPGPHCEWRLWLLLKQFSGTLQQVSMMRGPCVYFSDDVDYNYADQVDDWIHTREQEEWELRAVTNLRVSVGSANFNFSKAFIKAVLLKCQSLERLTTYHMNDEIPIYGGGWEIAQDDSISESMLQELKTEMTASLHWMWEHIPHSLRSIVGINVDFCGIRHSIQREITDFLWDMSLDEKNVIEKLFTTFIQK